MFKKKSSRNYKDSEQPRKSPSVTRYYGYQANSSDRFKKDSTRKNGIEEQQKSANKRFNTAFLSSLPQKIVIISIFVLIFMNVTLSSTTVKYSGGLESRYRIASDYTDGINEIFNSSIAYKTKFSFSSSKFENQIIQKFPEVSKATAIIPIAGRDLQVGLNFSEPLLKINFDENIQGVIGKDGFLLLKDNRQSIPRQFIGLSTISLEPGLDLNEGDQVLTANEVDIISLLINEFDGSSSYRYKLKNVIFNFNNREIHSYFEGVPFYAKLTPEREGRVQVGALVASLKDLQQQNKIPNEYIDVRVKDRVYVK